VSRILADDPEEALQWESVKPSRDRTYWGMVVRRFSRHRVAMVALGVLAVIALASALAPVLSPYSPNQPNLTAVLVPPGPHHLMGTDNLGVDLFSEVLYGGRISLSIGLLSAMVAVALGGLVGALAGYYRGWVDVVLMRLTDVALSVPLLFIVLLLALLAGPKPTTVIEIIGATAWMVPARIVRAEFLRLREREFVEAARACGQRDHKIIMREVFPNAMAPLIVNATLLVGQAIVIEAVMDFLGAGLSPPNISWGWLLNQAQAYVANAPWLSFFPGFMIFIVVLAVNLVGDGLRDALDPTMRL
jgi:peptide/nickel transport system permease protein